MITKALWIILKYLVIFFINKALLLFIGIESSANINLLIGFISILLAFLKIKTLFKILIIYAIVILFNNIFKITTGSDLLFILNNIITIIPYESLTPNINEISCIPNIGYIIFFFIILLSVVVPIGIKMYNM